MSFAALAGGAECGPVNPLAQLSKAYSNDRGVQQVRLSSLVSLELLELMRCAMDRTTSNRKLGHLVT